MINIIIIKISADANDVKSKTTHKINSWGFEHLVNDAKSSGNICAKRKYHHAKFPTGYTQLFSKERDDQEYCRV